MQISHIITIDPNSRIVAKIEGLKILRLMRLFYFRLNTYERDQCISTIREYLQNASSHVNVDEKRRISEASNHLQVINQTESFKWWSRLFCWHNECATLIEVCKVWVNGMDAHMSDEYRGKGSNIDDVTTTNTASTTGSETRHIPIPDNASIVSSATFNSETPLIHHVF